MKHLALPFTFAALSSISSLANATAVVLLEDNRWSNQIGQSCYEDYYDYYCDPSYNYQYGPAEGFADWNGNYQNSSVSGLLMTGSGSGSAYSDVGWYEQNAGFDVTFLVVEPTEVTLSGSASSYSEWGGGDAVTIQLSGPDDIIYQQWVYDDSFYFNNILMAGEYQLEIYTDVTPISDSDYEFTFAISPDAAVPVPAAAWLFASALLSLAGIRRKYK